jgi:hypothetical protein
MMASAAAMNNRGRARIMRRIFGSRRRVVAGFSIPPFDLEMP